MHHASLWNAGGWNAEDEAERVSVIFRQWNANRNMEPSHHAADRESIRRVIVSFSHPCSSGPILNTLKTKKLPRCPFNGRGGCHFFALFDTSLRGMPIFWDFLHDIGIRKPTLNQCTFTIADRIDGVKRAYSTR